MLGTERVLRRFPVHVWQWLMLVGGVALRMLFFAREGWIPILRGESVLIAISIAEKGTFANAYGGDSGRSAHLMPLYPLWQALLIRIFGTGPEARYAVAFFSSVAACLGFALFPKLSERAGMGAYAGVLAGLVGAFVPLNFFPQTEGGFETSFTFLAIVLLLWLWMKIWRDGDLRWPPRGWLRRGDGRPGLLTAILLPVAAAWLLLPMMATILPPGRRKDWLRFSIIACATTGLVFAPWVIRNKLALGKPLLTRSNFGLEMYKNNSDISPPTMEVAIKMPEYQARGPFGDDSERAKVRAMGEVAYNSEKLKLAEDWIRLHPRRFLVLTLERIGYFWFPPMIRPWQTAGGSSGDRPGTMGHLVLGTARPRPGSGAPEFRRPRGVSAGLLHHRCVLALPLSRLEGLLIFWMGAWVASFADGPDQSKPA